MRRQFQAVGIKNWSGQDLLDLQHEALKPVDGFFGHFPMFILSGCEVTANGDQTSNVAPGIVSLRGKDQDGNDTRMVVPFAGVKNTALPVYLKLGYTVGKRAYKSGGVKPVYYDFKAEATGVQPGNDIPYIAITGTQKLSFADVIQSAAYRFVSDVEKQRWNGKIDQAGVLALLASAFATGEDAAPVHYPNLTAGDSDKLEGHPADYFLPRETFENAPGMVDISGWTQPVSAGTYQLTEAIRANALYYVIVGNPSDDPYYYAQCLACYMYGSKLTQFTGSGLVYTLAANVGSPQIVLTKNTSNYTSTQLIKFYRIA